MEDNATTNEYPQLPTHNMNGKIIDGKDVMAAAPTKTKKRKNKKANKSKDGKQPSKAQKAQSKRPENSQVKVVAAKRVIGKGEGRVRSDSHHQGEGAVSSSANSITSNIGISDDKDKKRGKDGKVMSSLLKKKTWVPDDDEGTNDKDVVAAASSNDDLLKALQRKVENETKKGALAQKLQHMMSGGDDNNVSVNVDQPIASTERRAMNEMKKDALAQKLQRMMNGGDAANHDQSMGAYETVTNNLSTVPLGRPNHGFGQPGKKSPMDQNASSMLARSRTEAETKQVLNLYQSRMTQLVMHEQHPASARSDPSNLVAASGSSPSQSPQLAANIDDNVIRHLMLQGGEQQRALLQAPQVQESLRWLLQHEMQTNYQENGGDDPELIMRRQVMKEAKRDRVNRKLSAFMKSEEMLDEKQQAVTGKPLPSAEQQPSSSSDGTTLGAGSLLLSLSRGGGEWSVSPGERSHEQRDNGSTGIFPFVDSSVQHHQQQEQVTRVHSPQATQSRGVEEGRLPSASLFQGLAYSGGVNNQAMLMQRLLLQRRENNGHAPQQTSQDNSQRIIAESQSPVCQGTDEQTMMLKLLLQRDLDDMNIQLHRQIQNNSLGQGVSARDGGINSQHTIDRNHSDLVRQAAMQSLLTNQSEASQQPNTFSMDTSEAHDLARRRSLVESYIIMNEENHLRRLREAVQSHAHGGGDTPQHEMILDNAQETSLHQALALQAVSRQPSAVASVASTDPDAQASNSEQFAQLISSARERYT